MVEVNRGEGLVQKVVVVEGRRRGSEVELWEVFNLLLSAPSAGVGVCPTSLAPSL